MEPKTLFPRYRTFAGDSASSFTDDDIIKEFRTDFGPDVPDADIIANLEDRSGKRIREKQMEKARQMSFLPLPQDIGRQVMKSLKVATNSMARSITSGTARAIQGGPQLARNALETTSMMFGVPSVLGAADNVLGTNIVETLTTPTEAERTFSAAMGEVADRAAAGIVPLPGGGTMAAPFDTTLGKVERFVTETVPGAAASTLPFAAASVAGGPVAAAALGSSMLGAELSSEAKAMGASQEDQDKAFRLGALVGSSEALPFAAMIKRIGKLTGGAPSRILAGMAVQGTEESIQEIFQTFSSNVIAKGIYDEHRSVSEGLIESGLTGWVVGAMFGGAAHPYAAAQGIKDAKDRGITIEEVVELERIMNGIYDGVATEGDLDLLPTPLQVVEEQVASHKMREDVDSNVKTAREIYNSEEEFLASAEFKNFFKASQVVADDGTPLKVYHGTTERFEHFESTSDVGYHFGSAKAAEDRNKSNGFTRHGGVKILDLEQQFPKEMDSYTKAVAFGSYRGSTPLTKTATFVRETTKAEFEQGLDAIDASPEFREALTKYRFTSSGIVMSMYLNAKKLLTVNDMEGNWFEPSRYVQAINDQLDSIDAMVEASHIDAAAVQEPRQELLGLLDKFTKLDYANRSDLWTQTDEGFPVWRELRKRSGITDGGYVHPNAVLSSFTEQEVDAILTEVNASESLHETILLAHQFSTKAKSRQIIQNILGEAGYDGLVYRNSFEDQGSKSYIVFEPDQVQPAYDSPGILENSAQFTAGFEGSKSVGAPQDSDVFASGNIFHTLRSNDDAVAVLEGGLNPGSNVGLTRDSQSFGIGGGEITFVYDNTSVEATPKSYRPEEGIVSKPTGKPKAILVDTSGLIDNELVSDEEFRAAYDKALASGKAAGLSDQQVADYASGSGLPEGVTLDEQTMADLHDLRWAHNNWVALAPKEVLEAPTSEDHRAQAIELGRKYKLPVYQIESDNENGYPSLQKTLYTPPQPVGPETVEPEGSPFEGLNTRTIKRLREYYGYNELPIPDKVTWAEGLKRASEIGLFQNQELAVLARSVIRDPRPIRDYEHLAMALHTSELRIKNEDLLTQIEELHANGAGPSATAGLYAQVAEVNSEIDTITSASRLYINQGARLYRSFAFKVDAETYDVATIIRDAFAAQGGPLSEAQTKELTDLAIEALAQARKFSALEAKLGTFQEARVEEAAQQIFNSEVKRAKLERKKTRAKAKVTSLKEEMRKRFSLKAGLDPVDYVLLSRLLLERIRTGVFTYEQMVADAIASSPKPLTRADINKAMLLADNKMMRRLRGTTKELGLEFQKQAAMEEKLDKLLADLPADIATITPEHRQKIIDTQESIHEYKTQILKLSASVDNRYKATMKMIEKLENDLGFSVPGKPPNLSAALETLADIKASQRAKAEADRLNNLLKPENKDDLLLEMAKQDVNELTKQNKVKLKELIHARTELEIARQNVRVAIRKMQPYSKTEIGLNWLGLPRALMATADMSGTLRQGIFVTPRALFSPTRAVTVGHALGKQIGAFTSQHSAMQTHITIHNDPDYLLAESVGLYISELTGRLSQKEEFFTSATAENIPVYGHIVKASAAAMTTHLNLVRLGMFKQFIASNPGVKGDRVALRAMADYINVATGRGTLNPGAAVLLSAAFFSPRLLVSRFQTPYKLIQYWNIPSVRKEIAKDMASFFFLGMTTLTLAAFAGASVSSDPEDPDFGKILIGNTRVDIWGGFLPAARLMARLWINGKDRALGQVKEDGSPIGYELLWSFAKFKFSPALSLGNELIFTGESPVGEARPLFLDSDTKITDPGTWKVGSIPGAFIPLWLQDLDSAFNEHGWKGLTLSAVGEFWGMSIQTYGDELLDQDVRKYIVKSGYEPPPPRYVPLSQRSLSAQERDIIGELGVATDLDKRTKQELNQVFAAMLSMRIKANKGVLDSVLESNSPTYLKRSMLKEQLQAMRRETIQDMQPILDSIEPSQDPAETRRLLRSVEEAFRPSDNR